MIWDLYQQFKIEKIQREVKQVAGETRKVGVSSGQQADRFEHLCLAMEAVWSLMKEKHGLDNGDLLERMYEVDLEDGVKDGRISGRMISCLSCGQKINTRIKKCVYCGTENLAYSPFAS